MVGSAMLAITLAMTEAAMVMVMVNIAARRAGGGWGELPAAACPITCGPVMTLTLTEAALRNKLPS